MGFLDRAKKLAEQAKDAAEQAKRLAEQATTRASDALADATARTAPSAGTAPMGSTPRGAGGTAPAGPGSGTPYLPGMLGRPAWRERGLTDPAALLPIGERDRAGVPHTTKSRILEEPFGMGRRWSSGVRSAALFYQLYPEHKAWEPPGGRAPLTEVRGAWEAALPDGRTLVFLDGGGLSVVLEVTGIEDSARAALARTVAERLAAA